MLSAVFFHCITLLVNFSDICSNKSRSLELELIFRLSLALIIFSHVRNMKLISHVIILIFSLALGIFIGIQTKTQCCIEERTDLGVLIGFASCISCWTLLYVLIEESLCVGGMLRLCMGTNENLEPPKPKRHSNIMKSNPTLEFTDL